jgi:hypothetical protein
MYNSIQARSITAHPWRIAALVATVANITFNLINGHLGAPTPSVAEISERHPTLLTPASFGFAIWGVIYGATLLYAMFALLPSEAQVRVHDRVAPWLTVLNALASLWVALFTVEQLGPSVLISAAMLAAAFMIYTIVSDHIVSEHLSRWWRAPFGLWVGWLSVALLVNLNVALVAAGWSGWPSTALWASAALVLAAIGAHSVGALFLDPILAFVVAWAAIAIGGQHLHESALLATVSIAVALKCIWLGTRLLAFSTLPIPRSLREGAERQLRFSPSRATGAHAHAGRSAS